MVLMQRLYATIFRRDSESFYDWFIYKYILISIKLISLNFPTTSIRKYIISLDHEHIASVTALNVLHDYMYR